MKKQISLIWRGLFFLSILLCPSSIMAQISRTFRIDKQYLNFPIDLQEGRGENVAFVVDKDTLYKVNIAISRGQKEDFWIFKDVSDYKGKTLKLVFEEDHAGLDRIYQDDSFPGADSLYQEKYRPQFHFSSRRGWLNDPNGLVFHHGEYHLFYQHNPYGVFCDNMHWGHAVSKDLIHWEELNDAVYPDPVEGTILSGSSVVDVNNTAGFGENAIITAYTGHGPEGDTECIAYSTDNGRHFTKYEGNPVIDGAGITGADACRDPNVFWHEPIQKWVMCVHDRCSYNFYHSDDLKNWEYQSSVKGFYECPDIFELPVDGDPEHTKWVVMGASGTYMIGEFDGYKFTPEHGKFYSFWGNRQAGQTFNNVPDGRTIHMGWALNISYPIEPEPVYYPGMAFSQHMCVPVELSLRTTREGVRLFSEPVREIKQLHGKKYEWMHLTAAEVNKRLEEFKGDLFHLKVDLELNRTNELYINFRGTPLVHYSVNFNTMNGMHYTAADMSQLRFQFEILVDRTSNEVFIDHGQMHFARHFEPTNPEEGLIIMDNDGVYDTITIHSIELYEMNSIWEK